VDDPVFGGTTFRFSKRLLAPAQEGVALAVALVVAVDVGRDRQARREASTCTEWSITSSAGMCGLILAGSPSKSAIALRIAARSTIDGTPVKSCSSTRAGLKPSSRLGSARDSHCATASTPLSELLRTAFSSRIRSE
jgi:hypothetical protein